MYKFWIYNPFIYDKSSLASSIFIAFRPAIHNCLCPTTEAMHRSMMGLWFLGGMAHELCSSIIPYSLVHPWEPSWLIQDTINTSSKIQLNNDLIH